MDESGRWAGDSHQLPTQVGGHLHVGVGGAMLSGVRTRWRSDHDWRGESHRPSVWSRWDVRDDTRPGGERFGEHRGGHGDRPDGRVLGRSELPQRCLSGCGYDKDTSGDQ